jgi:nucleoside-diphosphate-sugar epimerase
MTQIGDKINAGSKVLFVGCGNVGQRIAKDLIRQGVKPCALSRSAEATARLAQLGITPVMGDLDDAASLANLSVGSRMIFYLAPPPASGSHDQRMANFLCAIPDDNPPSRIIYISTSGVYGDRAGEWVDEATEPRPETDRARRRLDAEQQLQTYAKAHGVAVVILRVGGIFSPDRLPIERIQRGIPVLNEEECGFINRIHADDLAMICIAAMERGEAGAIYNVSDGHPGTMTGYFYAVADAMGLPRPPALTMAEAQKVLNPSMLSYLTESRRLDNSRMLRELGIRLRYPDLKSGLAHLVSEH